jgi:hypothetical protein
MNKRKNNTSPLKIAVLGHKTIPSRQGGIEIVVEELTVRMAKLGHKITVYNRNGHHVSGKEFDEKKLKEYKGIRMKYVPTIDKKGLAAMSASFFAAVAAAFGKYDVVHFHAEGPCAMLWLPKLFGKRCIATVHGLDHQRAKWGKLASTYIMLGEKCAVKFADEIIVLSEGVQNYFKETYGRDTKFIPNGVNRPVIRKAELIDKKFGLKKDDYILFLGRLVPEKGITYLIESFKNVKTDNPVSLYAATKKSNELMAHAYSKLYNIPSTGLRFFTVYGPAGRPDMAYFGFTNKLLNGETIKIFNYGNCKRDFTYVDDIVEGVVRVMQGAPEKKNGEDGLPIPPYAVYNIGNNHPENLLDFVQILQEELIRAKVLPEDYDFEAHKELVPMQPGDVPVTYADTQALERDYGFKPSTTLREGLRKFAEWYKEFYM